jgi:hypothetical protein
VKNASSRGAPCYPFLQNGLPGGLVRPPDLLSAITVIFAVLSPLVAAAATHHTYAEGQIWSYHTWPEDPSSLLKISKIEVDQGSAVSPIYHICVVMVHIGGAITVNGHRAVAVSARRCRHYTGFADPYDIRSICTESAGTLVTDA